jgi:hypothetical protein
LEIDDYERQRLYSFLGIIDYEVGVLATVPPSKDTYALLDELSNLKNDIRMIIKRTDEGEGFEEAFKKCNLYSKMKS